MNDKIQTLHPDSKKQGVRIDRAKYEAVKAVILGTLESQVELTFKDLMTIVEQKLAGNFSGSIGWYYTTVKLDLEARGIIVRLPNTKPQRIRLVE